MTTCFYNFSIDICFRSFPVATGCNKHVGIKSSVKQKYLLNKLQYHKIGQIIIRNLRLAMKGDMLMMIKLGIFIIRIRRKLRSFLCREI